MEYRIEARAKDGHWYILGSERGCTLGWAEHIADGYRQTLPSVEIRVTSTR